MTGVKRRKSSKNGLSSRSSLRKEIIDHQEKLQDQEANLNIGKKNDYILANLYDKGVIDQDGNIL